MDEAALEAARHQVETACAQFQVSATRQQAEAKLLEFRQCSNPLKVCRHILERSTASAARFQALLTLRESAVRDWGRLTPEERSGLRTYLLHSLLSGAAGADNLVASQLAATLAQVIKRGWTEQSKPEREALFQEVEAAVLQTGDPQARRRGMEILSAVVTEFSPPTASAMGLPWVYHERCRMSLEADYLQRFFAHTCNVAREAVASGAAVAGADGGTCTACIHVLSAILSWDFQRGGGGIGGGGFGFVPEALQKGGTASDTMQIHLGPGWRSILLAPGSIGWLLQLMVAADGRPGTGPLLGAARHLTVQLCGVTGDIFAKDAEGTEARRQYTQALLQAVASWGSPADALVQAAERGNFELQEQLTDSCRGILALSSTHHAIGLLKAAEGTQMAGRPEGIFGMVADLSRAVIALGDVEEGLEGNWSSACADLLMDSWVAMLEETGRPEEALGRQAAAGAAHAVFEAFAAGALKDVAAALDCEDDDEAEEGGAAAKADEWMGRLALLGRAAAGKTLPLLASLLGQKLQQLQAFAAAGSDPSLVLEELCWLLRCSSHVLADPGDGEIPMVPLPLVQLAEASEGPCAIQDLSSALLTATCICLQPSARQVLSPRLLEVSASGAARWARTFLMPEEHLPDSLAATYSAQGGGTQVLDSLIKVSRELLIGWPGEVQLHLVTSKLLLPALTCRASLTSSAVRLESWQLLASDFARRADWVKTLAGRSQRALSRAVVAVTQGLESPQEVHQYLVGCLGFLPPGLAALVQVGTQGATPQSDAANEAANLLDVLRGATASTSGANAGAMWSLMEVLLQPLLDLYRVYRTHQVVVTLVLKVGHDLVEANMSFISNQQAGTLCMWVVEVIRQHAANRRCQAGMAVNKAIRDQEEQEAYRELRALLKLLTQLTQRDVSERGRGSGVDVAQAVFAGLELILPLMTSHIAHFPKLRLAYFGLLSYMAEVHSARLSALPLQQFSMLASSLEYGIRSVLEVEAVQAVLEAASALGQWHLADCRAGGGGLGQHTMPSGSPVIPALMEAVLQRLLFEDTASEVCDSAADALLPMLLASPGTYQALGNSLLSVRSAAGDSAAAQEALAQALGGLVQGVADGSSRTDRRRFRGSLGKFLVSVRGIVRTR